MSAHMALVAKLQSSRGLGRWTRKGDCNHCGFCCQNLAVERHVIYPTDERKGFAPTEARFWELRGGVPELDTRTGKVRVFLLQASMHAPCPEHQPADMDPGLRGCAIYDQRPAACRVFPETPEQIEGSPCSYWFEIQVGDDVVRRGGQGSPYPTTPTYPDHLDERKSL